MSFSISTETSNGAFSINSQTGQLIIANEILFDFETNPVLNATVKVTNGFVFEISNITITLNDIEEPNIYTGDVHLYSQEDINAFGLNQYTEITGLLRLNDMYWNIVSLAPLSSITKVENLKLSNCDKLIGLNGLNNLKEIETNLTIESCDLLTNISHLSNLLLVGNNIIIHQNEALISLNGLSGINSINGHLSIFQNQALTSLNNLNNLTSIGGLLEVSSNFNLTTLNGLNNLSNVSGRVYIQTNDLLISLDGLDSLTTTGDGLKIYGNATLKDFCNVSILINNNGVNSPYIVEANLFNPSVEDIINGNCSL